MRWTQARVDEAEEAARAAIGIDPNDSYNFFILARVHLDQERAGLAQEALEEAIRLDPDAPVNHFLLAAVLLDEDRRDEALEAVDAALALNPENAEYMALRANILNQAHRHKEALAMAEEALRKAPNSPSAHTQVGWARLRANQPKPACASFQAALAIDPENEAARAGIVAALKARVPIYRLVLGFFFKLQSLSPKARWGVILGLYFGAKVLRGVARTTPELQPVLYPLLGAYVLFVFLSWTASPLSALFLFLHPVGRHALDRDEKLSSGLVGSLLLACVALGGAGALQGEGRLAVAGLAGLLYMIPLSGLHTLPPGAARLKMGLFVGGIGVCGVLALGALFVAPDQLGFAFAYVMGCFLFSWVRNAVGR